MGVASSFCFGLAEATAKKPCLPSMVLEMGTSADLEIHPTHSANDGLGLKAGIVVQLRVMGLEWCHVRLAFRAGRCDGGVDASSEANAYDARRRKAPDRMKEGGIQQQVLRWQWLLS